MLSISLMTDSLFSIQSKEWYHGSCVGISESKADKFEKYTCVRCLTKETLTSSSTTAVGIIKKVSNLILFYIRSCILAYSDHGFLALVDMSEGLERITTY